MKKENEREKNVNWLKQKINKVREKESKKQICNFYTLEDFTFEDIDDGKSNLS